MAWMHIQHCRGFVWREDLLCQMALRKNLHTAARAATDRTTMRNTHVSHRDRRFTHADRWTLHPGQRRPHGRRNFASPAQLDSALLRPDSVCTLLRQTSRSPTFSCPWRLRTVDWCSCLRACGGDTDSAMSIGRVGIERLTSGGVQWSLKGLGEIGNVVG